MHNDTIDWNEFEAALRGRLAAEDKVRLEATPDFPLAFNVAMPDDFAFPNGHVGIRFEDFEVSGVTSPHLDRAESSGGAERALLNLRWDRMRVEGRYAVSAKEAPVITMDTAGTMLDYDDDEEILPAGADGVTPLSGDEKDAMLDNARAQRTRLMDDPKGAKMMAQYNEHNEVYNSVFVTSAAARNTWAAEGATKDMAKHTHVAVGTGKDDPNKNVVNPPENEKTFGNQKVSYNANAFRQQSMMYLHATLLRKKDRKKFYYQKEWRPDPDSKNTQAALAAMDFGKGVEGNTGNKKDSSKAMTGKQVFGAVNTGTEPAKTSVDELYNALKQGESAGGAAAAVAEERGWRVLDEEDRRFVRRLLVDMAREDAEEAAALPEQIWAGACRAELAGAEAEIELVRDGGELRLVAHRVALPAFELEIDDAAWDGEAAEVVRERLAAVGFVRSLLRERIQSALAARVAQAVCSTIAGD